MSLHNQINSMQNYKYFKDCNTIEEVKKAFKPLAMKLHPDKGGKQEEFIAMKQEYDRIIASGIAPGKDKRFADMEYKDIFDMFQKQYHDDFSGIANWEARQREQRRRAEQQKTAYQTKATFDKAQTNRVEYFFENMRKNDPIYSVIDGVIEEANQKEQTANWFLFEMYKLEELSLNHFKYAAFKLKLKAGWAETAYKNYINSTNIEWK